MLKNSRETKVHKNKLKNRNKNETTNMVMMMETSNRK